MDFCFLRKKVTNNAVSPDDRYVPALGSLWGAPPFVHDNVATHENSLDLKR